MLIKLKQLNYGGRLPSGVFEEVNDLLVALPNKLHLVGESDICNMRRH